MGMAGRCAGEDRDVADCGWIWRDADLIAASLAGIKRLSVARVLKVCRLARGGYKRDGRAGAWRAEQAP
ncbi:hypothetical protein SAMN05216264_105228 [Pseudomonas marincola]|nr:hypothetical protein SAMN05216264_105228 [Pseudomonas marincola]